MLDSSWLHVEYMEYIKQAECKCNAKFKTIIVKFRDGKLFYGGVNR